MAKVSTRPLEKEEYTHYLFFFANPRSGDQAAKRFLKGKQRDRSFNMKFEAHAVDLFGHIFNVTVEQEKKHAYGLIKKTYKAHGRNEGV